MPQNVFLKLVEYRNGKQLNSSTAVLPNFCFLRKVLNSGGGGVHYAVIELRHATGGYQNIKTF